MDVLAEGIAALKAGDKARARVLFAQILKHDPQNEQAWLWLSGVTEDNQRRLACLEKVLEINPNNQHAQRGIAALKQQDIG